MSTIYEVAAKAGVSPATVSRVLNGLKVSSAKSDAVRAAAAELSFSPNKTARSLRKQNSEVIALVIPDIENPFFTALARGVEDRLREAGFSLVLCNTDDDTETEAKYFEIAVSENMAGVILVPAADHTDLSPLLSRNRPVVAVDRSTGHDIDVVTMENRAAGLSATRALLASGYSRVACIAGPRGIETADDRSGGWQDALNLADRAADPTYLCHANYRVDGGRAAMLELLSLADPPDAVVVTNNLMGVGALQVLSEAGMAPPAFGVAVIGDLPFTTLDPTSVTIVHLPARNLGVTAASMLIERINGDRQSPRTVVLRNEVAIAVGGVPTR
ncbi:LacI family transcriptional regulator [Subtercola boreus]|uniref:LacI family transcriptional regulator n=2 Tax=Subtercola boreus TaxID=120213 RepID=A0A3E0VU83_9MICO|nr:LacI family transcriptional regulator [Subtercola boreus]